MTANPVSSLQIVGVRYFTDRAAPVGPNSLDAYAISAVYDAAGVPYSVTEPTFPESLRAAEPAVDLGLLGGAIADVVAAARHAGCAVMMVGGNCTHMTGVLGGLQDAHGADARIGLVWFDAHGDYNTPSTSITGRLGGMPVAVAAGLALPEWRERSHMSTPLPTDRIVLVDVRNLDPAEARLIHATSTTIAAAAPAFGGADLAQAVAQLTSRVDMVYLHIDADILDAPYVPSHWTVEPHGPTMAQVLSAIDVVMATGKVVAFAVVSVPAHGNGGQTTVASGIDLIRGGLTAWRRHGTVSM
jgi:arginase